jgi:hypothetical protein
MGTTHILQCGDKLDNKKTQQSDSSTNTDKTRNKMADIKQGTDEILGRYPTQLLFNPSSTHIDLLHVLFQRAY